jgi:biopolymer transport protein ExbB
VISDALSLYTEGYGAVEEIVQASLIKERQRYERSLSYLGTVGSNAPFIGLLGTVIGVILAFAELGRNPKGGLEVVGPGISEALVATAVGLVVAIPSLICFNWMKSLLKRRLSNSDFLARIVVTQLKRKNAPVMRGSAAFDDAETELPSDLLPAPAGAE